MNKPASPNRILPPDFSHLHAIQDGVLVCTKKDGNAETFKYRNIEEVIYNGKPLQVVFDEMAKFYADTRKTISELSEQVEAMKQSQIKFVEILKGGASQ